MTSSRPALRLAACLLNVSEARKKDIVERIATAALYDKHGRMLPETTVLNIFSDYDYNRSVITIAATRDQLRIADEVATRVPGCSLFLFGYADNKEKKQLAEKRKSLGWFKKKTEININDLKVDVGAKPSIRYGITG
ncbi:formiminotransferase N-terminal subdomain-containing protein isoform X5 [Bombina bombina]|nr:formiminotransferase N-terminal subdomain-containing protein isoform X5 [Bombina bombina]